MRKPLVHCALHGINPTLNSSQARRALPVPASAPPCRRMPSGPYQSYSRLAVASDRTSALDHRAYPEELTMMPSLPILAEERPGAASRATELSDSTAML